MGGTATGSGGYRPSYSSQPMQLGAPQLGAPNPPAWGGGWGGRQQMGAPSQRSNMGEGLDQIRPFPGQGNGVQGGFPGQGHGLALGRPFGSATGVTSPTSLPVFASATDPMQAWRDARQGWRNDPERNALFQARQAYQANQTPELLQALRDARETAFNRNPEWDALQKARERPQAQPMPFYMGGGMMGPPPFAFAQPPMGAPYMVPTPFMGGGGRPEMMGPPPFGLGMPLGLPFF